MPGREHEGASVADPGYSAQVNDLIGGWIVTQHHKPLSEHDTRNGEVPICETGSSDDAHLIARALNTYAVPGREKITFTLTNQRSYRGEPWQIDGETDRPLSWNRTYALVEEAK